MEGTRLHVHYTDQDIFAEELCSLGDEVLVLEPAPLTRGHDCSLERTSGMPMSSAPRRPSTTDNLLLLLALVPYVLDRGEVPVAQAAEQFGRSEDDIVKAIELIACAGIPGDSLAYSHLDLFDIDWDLWEEQRIITFWNTVAIDHQPRFSAREASALLAGLQYLATHPSYSHRSDIDEVMTKLRAGAGAGPADRIAVGGEAVETHLVVLEEALSYPARSSR